MSTARDGMVWEHLRVDRANEMNDHSIDDGRGGPARAGFFYSTVFVFAVGGLRGWRRSR